MPQTCHTKQPHCSQAHASLNLFIIIPILISNLGVRAHGQNPPLSPIHLLHSLPPRLHICSSIASYDTPHHLITKTHSRLGISPLPYRPTFFLPSYSYRTQPPPNSPKQNLKVLIKIKILGTEHKHNNKLTFHQQTNKDLGTILFFIPHTKLGC